MRPAYEIAIMVGITALIIIAGYAIGKIVKTILKKALERIGFNEWFIKFAIGKAIIRGGYTPSEFLSSVISWIIHVSSVLIAINYLSNALELSVVSEISYTVLMVYLIGFIKAFAIILVGFMLIDSFVNYIYKSSELRTSEEKVLVSIAEYLRILFYIAVLIFALEIGGLTIESLKHTLTPIIWGLTVVMIILVAKEIAEAVSKK